jgi:hypothetical protein
MDHHDGFLLFIVTHSYTKFVLACDYIIKERLIGLIAGDNGAGKSWAVVQYIRSSARLLDNGRYPYLYVNLSDSEKTDRAIYKRNRTWPGVSPEGKLVTSMLLVKNAKHIRAEIAEYVRDHPDNSDELWILVRGYCQFGPLGLLDALNQDLPPIIPENSSSSCVFIDLVNIPGVISA